MMHELIRCHYIRSMKFTNATKVGSLISMYQLHRYLKFISYNYIGCILPMFVYSVIA